jgi:photosystem II stability/assembly factor-like uncharacterized protein
MAKAVVEQKKKQSKKPQHPQQRKTTQARPSRMLLFIGAAGLIALAGVAIMLTRGSGEDTTGAAAAALPNTSDYHSLLVAPNAPDQLVLGTHQGLFRSTDGGRTWAQAELVNQDAMNLARASGKTVWAAGHGVLARSSDGGGSWQDVQPRGLPASLDIHGFAVDPDSGRLWAAVAGEGLYRSDDGGVSFSLSTSEVGAGVMGLEILPGGRMLAADMQQQALLSSEDGGKTWSRPLDRPVMTVAAAPNNPKLLLASILGNDAGIVRSVDGGESWDPVLALPEGPGPIAWSESEPKMAYVVSLDRTLFRSTDAGLTWQQVTKRAR